MTLRLKLQGTVVVHRARSVTIEESVRLSSENIVRYYISIEKKRPDFNTVFTQEQNDLFIQQVHQYSQENKSDELHYHVLGLNKSST